ncbi:hypothetical protein JTB14_013084 [Gonioctena quinquepunctata]|nr:hypothetical protein JTB14_013084 [Gonioctena quinquepunctata]
MYEQAHNIPSNAPLPIRDGQDLLAFKQKLRGRLHKSSDPVQNKSESSQETEPFSPEVSEYVSSVYGEVRVDRSEKMSGCSEKIYSGIIEDAIQPSTSLIPDKPLSGSTHVFSANPSNAFERFLQNATASINTLTSQATFHSSERPVPPTAPPPPQPLPILSSTTQRNRTVIGRYKSKILQDAFDRNQFLTVHDKERLARITGLPDRVIQIWFQNRRREKKCKEKLSSSKSCSNPPNL